MAEESTTWLVIPCACKNRCNQKPSRPASEQLTTGAVSGKPRRRLAWAISSSTRSCCRALTVRSRGFWPWPVVKPSFQVFSRSAKATNSVTSVVLLYSCGVAAVVIGFLLHGKTFGFMEKKRTNSGRLREPADKHSIYRHIRHPFWARRRISSHATLSARIPVGGEHPGGTSAAM